MTQFFFEGTPYETAVLRDAARTAKYGAQDQGPGPHIDLPQEAPGNEAMDFLRAWPTQRMHLWARVPDGLIEAHTFDRTDAGYAAAEKWIAARNGKSNLYFVVNDISVTLGVDKRPDDKGVVKTILKPRETDVTRMVATHVDSDPRVDLNLKTPEEYAAHFAEEKARLLAVYDKHEPRLNVILFSGGGMQGFHLLKEPVEIGGDPKKVAEWKLANIALRQAPGFAGSDKVQSLEHVMRLPGTKNLPDEKKRGRGRVPARAYMVRFDERALWHDAAELPKAEPDPEQNRNAGGFQLKAGYEPISRDDPALKALEPRWLDLGISGDATGYGGDRSDMAFAFATAAKRAGIADDVLARCLMDPEWKVGECIRDKGGERLRVLKRLIENAGDAAEDDDLAEMNRKHCVIEDIGGKCVVVNEAFDLKRKRKIITFSSVGALHNRYANKKKRVATDSEGKPVYRPLADWWIHHARRRQFNQVTFAPGQDIAGAFNLYRGLSVAPAEGDCGLYLTHVRDNICGGDETLYNYLLEWMASGVQRPDEPGRTAISLRGNPGDGKGVFVQGYGQIFGRHFLQVTQPDHLTSKFNAHEAEAVLVYADEVAFSGDTKAARVFKTKISEETKLLERKGIDAVEVENYARYIFATNEGHPLQIEHNDRRYLAIKVRTNPLWANETDERRAADKRHEYFQPIVDQMKNGGRAALLRMLLDRDISKFNAESFPRTEEGRRQIRLSAPAGDKVIIGFAQEGQLPGALDKRPWIAVARGKGNLYEAMRERGDHWLRVADEQKLADIIKEWGFKSHHLGYGRGWQAPALAELRAAVSRKYPGVEWDSNGLKEWGGRLDDDAEPGIPF